MSHAVSPTFNPYEKPLFDSTRKDIPEEVIEAVKKHMSNPDDNDIIAQLVTLWRGMFIEIGKRTLMLPQTVARICRDLGLEKLSLINDAITESGRDVRSVSYSWEHSPVRLNMTQRNRLLEDDLALIKNYLAVVSKKDTNDRDIAKKLGNEEEAQRRINLRLETLQQQPYIFNAQIMRLASLYCDTEIRNTWVERTVKILEPYGLQDGWESVESWIINETMNSLMVSTLTAAPFGPKNFGKHEQIKSIARDAEIYKRHPTEETYSKIYAPLLKIKDWLPFFTIGEFPIGSRSALSNWLIGIANEDDLLHKAPTKELKSRVHKIISSCNPTSNHQLALDDFV